LDREAADSWGLNHFALVEAAGRGCAEVLLRAFPRLFDTAPAVTVLAGSGNNAADALVMLRSFILHGYADPESARVLMTRRPNPDAQTPLGAAVKAIQTINVPVLWWDAEGSARELLAGADIIIDGIAGTGVSAALSGPAREMADAVNAQDSAAVVSVDVPSGNFDGWKSGDPMVRANATLAIEPQKRCLYNPAARKNAGNILPVTGIFPAALTDKYAGAELLDWKRAAGRIPPAGLDAYKYCRGTVEIRAGSPGFAGAAKLAAKGAQAGGAGLVRLIVDPALYPILGPDASGIMVAPDDGGGSANFPPDAVLLGPGWGRGCDRVRILESYLPLEERGLPLVLDAGAIHLAQNRVFHGNVILTPHAGEFAAYTGIPREDILADPVPIVRRFASEKKICVLFKSHVLYIAAPDGRLGVVDGMCPVLGAGGSGDLLAGLCAAVAGRSRAADCFDGYTCACAAAALLIESARSREIAGRFIDPAELAAPAARIAGRAWLPAGFGMKLQNGTYSPNPVPADFPADNENGCSHE
jgi:NAD(P)H-hydrate epimerase